jgi:hypothetical protein
LPPNWSSKTASAIYHHDRHESVGQLNRLAAASNHRQLEKRNVMKRVRYVLGAAGLAPIAAGLAAPAAHAATVPSSATSQGKVVSLHHTGMQRISRQAATATTAASSSAATSPQITAAGCHGNTKVKIPQSGHVKGKLWYANNYDDSYTCIGTVDASLYYSHDDCKWVSVSAGTYSRDLGNYGTTWGPERKTVCGTDGKWTVQPFGIHESFYHDPVFSAMRVFVWSQYGGNTYAQFGS